MDSINQIREHFIQMKNGSVVPKEHHTHFLEIFTLLKSGILDLASFFATKYTSDSLTTNLKFADGKTYEIRIKEILNEK